MEQKKSTVKIICIVISYVVMYGLLSLILLIADSSSIACIIFLVICMAFTYKSCKGMLVDHLSDMPWPVFIVLIILLSAVIGCFTAPYHIGKWISDIINGDSDNQ